MVYKISESLVIANVRGKLVYQCAKCGHSLGPADKSWKRRSLRLISPLSKAGYRRSTSGRFEMREYICPKCAIVFDVEVALPGDEPLYDLIDVATIPKDALK